MLDKAIDGLKDELIAAVQESVRIPSVAGVPEEGAPFGRNVKLALDHALNVASQLGFRVKNVDNMAGYGEWGDGKEIVAILGHLDVVPEGTGWKYPPFGGEIQNGMIWGRGVLDDKGPTIGALFALKAIKDLNISLKRRIRVIFGTNEESGSQCMSRYVQTEELPAAGFTPDAEYPIIYAEKGVLTLTCHFPFSGDGPVKIVSFKGGVAPNVVAATAQVVIRASAEERRRIASIVDAWNGPERSGFKIVEDGVKGTITIEVQGVPAHGSTPHLGVNAILCLVDILSSMDLMKSQKQFIHALSSLIGMETDGTSLGIAMNDGISGALTLCLGTIDGNESDVHFTLNIRYPVTKKDSLVLDPLREALEKAGIAVTDVRHAAPLYMDPESPLIRTLQKVYKEQTGLNPDLLAIGGGTYAKSVPNVVAFGPIFPGQKYTIHEENECWSIEDLMKNVKIMAHAMVELAR
ncbi:dipeptidase PepV [Aminobacterium mobile]|uniref:dipeptidase PepV n=1 Tax=Aminobacterium mobile TaxID=81467 RepID=UPI003314E9E3